MDNKANPSKNESEESKTKEYLIKIKKKDFYSAFDWFLKIMTGIFIIIFVATMVLPIFVTGQDLQVIIGALICILVFYFSLWRYCDLRWKNCQTTYEYFILLADVVPEVQKELTLQPDLESAPPKEPHKSAEVLPGQLEGVQRDSGFHLFKVNVLQRFRKLKGLLHIR